VLPEPTACRASRGLGPAEQMHLGCPNIIGPADVESRNYSGRPTASSFHPAVKTSRGNGAGSMVYHQSAPGNFRTLMPSTVSSDDNSHFWDELAEDSPHSGASFPSGLAQRDARSAMRRTVRG